MTYEAQALSVPYSPVYLQQHPPTESSIKITWGFLIPHNPNTGVRVKWGPKPYDYADLHEIDLPFYPNSSHTITGLAPATQYRIHVFGTVGEVESSGSKQIEATTEPATPVSPANLKAWPSWPYGYSIKLTWSESANARSYKIDYGIEPGGPSTEVTSSTPEHTINGLRSSTHYYFEVRSSNPSGNSAPSRVTRHTQPIPPTPTDLEATSTITSMELMWTPSPGAVDYVIRYGVEPGGTPKEEFTSSHNHKLTGLIKNTLYFVEVSARNGNGESSPARITEQTPDGPPLPLPPDWMLPYASFDTITVVWAQTPREPGYEVTYGLEHKYPEFIAKQMTEEFSTVIEHVVPDTRYFLELRSVNASGVSDAIRRNFATRIFEPPRDLSAVEWTDDSATWQWSAGTDYSSDMQYEVFLGNQYLDTVKVTHFVLKDLIEETEYVFRVRAKTRVGLYSDYSTGNFKTRPYSGVRICSPGNLRAFRQSATTAILTWDEPYATCDLCPDAIGYEAFGEGITRINVSRPPCEITGLKANTDYLIYVTTKGAGNNVSRPSIYRFLKMGPPGIPGTPVLSELSHDAVNVSWAPSAHYGESVHYSVYLNGVLIKEVSAPNTRLTHLKSHTDYQVKVRAVNAAGVSEPSILAFKTRVRAPTNLRFSQRNGMCRLAWDPVFKQAPSHEVSINGQVFTIARGFWGYNFRLADVSPGPVPHYLKFAVHARQDEDTSEVSLLERTVADDVPPSRPGAPVVSNITEKGATLSWEPSSDDVGVSGYQVVLNGLLVFPTLGTRFTFTGLTSGAYHWVYVRARDNEGNLSGGSPRTVFQTTGQAPSPRPQPPEASITALTSRSARLEWKDQEEIADAGVRILINEEHFRDVHIFFATVLTDLIPNAEYSISVSTFDIFGQLSEPTTLVYEPRDATPPSVPRNLCNADIGADWVKLKWDEATDDVGVCEYVIYSNHEYFDSTPLTHYTAVDLLPGTHSFEVWAMDLSGNASDPAALTVFIKGPPSDAPTNFRFSQPGFFPTLEWDAPDTSDNVIRYSIDLTGPNGGTLPYESIGTILKPVLFPRTRYEASITAITANGRSLPLMGEFTTK